MLAEMKMSAEEGGIDNTAPPFLHSLFKAQHEMAEVGFSALKPALQSLICVSLKLVTDFKC